MKRSKETSQRGGEADVQGGIQQGRVNPTADLRGSSEVKSPVIRLALLLT